MQPDANLDSWTPHEADVRVPVHAVTVDADVLLERERRLGAHRPLREPLLLGFLRLRPQLIELLSILGVLA